MEEQGCPRCKTTKYRNPSMKLLVNVCGHSLCESCVDLLFIKGSGGCPECGTALRRNNFRLQLFEDANVEKEVDIRKRVLRDFNKKEEDFQSLNEYNDYLEMIETVVFNLTNGVEEEQTKKMIDQYKKENREIIQKNKSKMSKDEAYLDSLIEQEKHDAEFRKKILLEKELEEKNKKKLNKEALIDELMFSDMPASMIMATHKAATTETKENEPVQKSATHFSQGMKVGFQNMMPVPLEEGEAYQHVSITIEMCGPSLPLEDTLQSAGYLKNVRSTSDSERGGGFESRMACHRALQDALSGLFYFPGTSCS
ncbi:hypothetical protein ScPMuIL_014629 [Solemya velum]